MKKLAVYPYSKELSAIARFKNMLAGYELSALYAPKSFGFYNCDAGEADSGGQMNIVVKNFADDAIKDFDTIFIDYHPNIVNNTAYINLINECVSLGKEILLSQKLSKELYRTEAPPFPVVDANDFSGKPIEKDDISKGLLDIDVPVILVLGAGEQANKFELQLAVRRHFVNQGYKVCQLGTKEYSGLFGFLPLPSFITSEASLTTRTISFNRYLYYTVRKEDPDVVIIDVPGSIMKFSRKVVSNFGEAASVIANATSVDVAILSMHMLPFKLDFFTTMQDYCKFKLDCPVKYFNIANTSCSYSTEEEKLTYLTLDYNHVISRLEDEIKQCEDIHVFNVFNRQMTDRVCSNIEADLAGNVDFV
ncbi:MAG: TIGR04066 family peptide maturation system protein [Firmicutes bacterium]|nr:TIGR04066 family peptide maturation system protein [Bacillota bacterium]